MSSSKRSLDGHSPRSVTSQAGTADDGAKKRAKDWRDAFLDEAPPSRSRDRSRDRERGYDRRRDGRSERDRERRYGDGLDYEADWHDRSYRDRDRSRDHTRDRDRHDRYSDRDDKRRVVGGREGNSTSNSSGSAHREHARRGEGAALEGGAHARGGKYNSAARQPGDTFSSADPAYARSTTGPATSTSASHPYASNGNGGRGISIAGRSRAPIRYDEDREEGEIESPPKGSLPLPVDNAVRPSINAPAPSTHARGMSGGFRSINIPSQPRAARLGHAGANGNVLEGGNDDGRATKRARVEGEAVEKAREAESNEPVVVIEEEIDPEKVLEERRKKREEIMARFKAQKEAAAANPAAVAAAAVGLAKEQLLGTGADSVTSGGTRTGLTTAGATTALRALGTRSTSVMAGLASTATPTGLPEPSLASTPMGQDFDLAKNDASPSKASVEINAQQGGGDDTSAADYDPSAAGLEDQVKREHDRALVAPDAKEVAAGVGEPAGPDAVAAKKPSAAADKVAVAADDEWEEVEMEVDDDDEEVDMFAAFEDDDAPKKKKKIKVRRRKAGFGGGAGGGAGAGGTGDVAADVLELVQDGKAGKKAATAVDNVDDTDGYYRITPGEILDDGRYQVTISLGKGMFSGVVKAKVLKAVDQERRQDVVGREVAIKVIRSQESMYVAGRKEAQILKKLNDADPDDKKHIVRMERTFQHHGHLCIVTESLSMNLRDVIKRFGKDVGLNMRAVRAYAHQLFLAMSLMRKCGYVHADIKPDNVLVSENKATLKVCDLGSAAEVSEGEITPYLVSRFYRAPEIILGLPYDTAIDIWSIGCTLYELYTGKILFPGRSNNHMLRLMMEVKGKLNHRLIKKASFGEMYFDENINFLSVEKDKITGADTLKTLVINTATRDLRSRLLPPSSVQIKMKDDELKQLLQFVDLLDKCLQLDPAKRITPRDALLHPFLSG